MFCVGSHILSEEETIPKTSKQNSAIFEISLISVEKLEDKDEKNLPKSRIKEKEMELRNKLEG